MTEISIEFAHGFQSWFYLRLRTVLQHWQTKPQMVQKVVFKFGTPTFFGFPEILGNLRIPSIEASPEPAEDMDVKFLEPLNMVRPIVLVQHRTTLDCNFRHFAVGCCPLDMSDHNEIEITGSIRDSTSWHEFRAIQTFIDIHLIVPPSSIFGRYAPGQFFKEHHDGRFRPAQSISVSMFLVLGSQRFWNRVLKLFPVDRILRPDHGVCLLEWHSVGILDFLDFLDWLNWPPLRKQFWMCFVEAWRGWWDVFPRAQHEGAAVPRCLIMSETHE